MTIIIICAVALVVAVIAYIVGAVSHTQPLPDCCLTCLHDHHNHRFGTYSQICCNHYGLGTLQDKVREQEQLIWSLRRDFELNQRHKVEKVFYAPTVEQQKMVDHVMACYKPLSQMAKDLGIDLMS